MIILITGVPGSGKTLYAVQLLEEYILANDHLLKTQQTPRDIFSDIDGLVIEGVKKSPTDWRDVPDGSVVCYDECQRNMGPDGQGRSSREDIQELETHRHRGIDIILITQHPKLLHAHVRRLIGRHYHLFRMYGAETAKVFRADKSIDVDKAASLNREDSVIWPYPKKLYGRYQSATVHTHKRKLPAWMIRSGIAVLVMLGLMAVFVWYAKDFFLSNMGEEVAQPVGTFQWEPEPIANSAPAEASSDRGSYPAGCIWSSERCICYDSERWLIQSDMSTCIDQATGPWERLPEHRSSSRSTYTPGTGRNPALPSGSEARGSGPVSFDSLRL